MDNITSLLLKYLTFQFKTHTPVDLAVITEEGIPVPPRTEVFVALTPSIIFADADIKWFSIVIKLCNNMFVYIF